MASKRQDLIAAVGRATQAYQRATDGFDDEVGRKLGLNPTDLRCLDWLSEDRDVGRRARRGDGPLERGDDHVARPARAEGLRPAGARHGRPPQGHGRDDARRSGPDRRHVRAARCATAAVAWRGSATRSSRRCSTSSARRPSSSIATAGGSGQPAADPPARKRSERPMKRQRLALVVVLPLIASLAGVDRGFGGGALESRPGLGHRPRELGSPGPRLRGMRDGHEPVARGHQRTPRRAVGHRCASTIPTTSWSSRTPDM